MIEKKCLVCGNLFKIPKCRLHTAKYCCKDCFNNSKKGTTPVNKGKLYELRCLACGNLFQVKQYRKDNAKYCSKKCYWSIKGKSPEERLKNSIRLKEYYKTHKSYWTGKKRGATSLEVRQKLSEAIRGEKAYQWKGGVSKLYETIRKTDIYKDWRTKVFERDGYICQLCNVKGKTMNVHHKKPVKDIIKEYNIETKWDSYHCKALWDVNNGITLCEACHRKVHREKV